jgi:ABC-2 type transport system permease protein
MLNLFPNAWTVAIREYRVRVRSRVFRIATVILALVGLGLALMPVAIKALGFDQPSTVAVYGASSDVDNAVTAMVTTLDAGTQVTVDATAVDNPDAARTAVADGDSDGLVTIDRGADDELTFDFYTSEGPTSSLLFIVNSTAQQVTVGDRLLRAGVDPGQAAVIFAPTAFKVTPVDPNATNPEDNFGPRYVLATALLVLMFMAVITYGQWVTASVVEEKSSRVMELLITAATPRQLLVGKIIGAGGAGLTQYLFVVGAAIVGLLLQAPLTRLLLGEDAGSVEVSGLDPTLLLFVGLFFVGGFALYATLFAAVGSTATRQEDVQTITGPMVILSVAGYLVSFAALNSPDAPWVRLLSFFPFFTPYLFPIRMVLGSVAPWEIVLALILLAAAVVVAIWVAGRIYSAGVLLYGQRAGLRAVWRAVRVNR